MSLVGVPSTVLLVTMDPGALYTNILHGEARLVVEWMLEQRENPIIHQHIL